jgi:hypothetical protein
MVFERKIFAPSYQNGSWRIKTSEQLDKIIKHKNIINLSEHKDWDGLVILK